MPPSNTELANRLNLIAAYLVAEREGLSIGNQHVLQTAQALGVDAWITAVFQRVQDQLDGVTDGIELPPET